MTSPPRHADVAAKTESGSANGMKNGKGTGTPPCAIPKVPPRTCHNHAKKRPVRCGDTILPDTFHLKVMANKLLYLAGSGYICAKYNGFQTARPGYDPGLCDYKIHCQCEFCKLHNARCRRTFAAHAGADCYTAMSYPSYPSCWSYPVRQVRGLALAHAPAIPHPQVNWKGWSANTRQRDVWSVRRAAGGG